MHPHRQTPSARDPPDDDYLSPYGQMPPLGYVNNPFYSNMTPNNQVYGGPPTNFPPPHPFHSTPSASGQAYGGMFADDQNQHHTMAFPGPLAPSHLSPTLSSAYNADYRQRSLATSANKSPTQTVPQYFHGADPQNPKPRMPTSMACPYVSSSDNMLLRQASKGQHHSSFRPSSIVASTNGEASFIGTTNDNVNANESFRSDSTPLRAIAQRVGALVDLRDNDPSTQQSACHQRGSSVTLDPVDQKPTSPQPILEPETSERQDTEEIITSQPYLSLDSTTSGSDKDGEEDFDQETTNDEVQEVATALQPEDDLDKMDKYAFNFAREAYDHHVPQQLTNGITFHVNSLAPLTITLKQRRDEFNDVAPTLLPQPNEFQKGFKTVECVWVGMLPSPPAVLQIQTRLDQPSEEAGTEGVSKRSARKRSLKKTSTVSGIRDDETKVIAFDQEALRVVAKKSDKITKDIHIYALVQTHHTSNLQGFKVGFDDVFYFREFRDDTAVSIMRRKQATVAKIKASVFHGVAHAVSQSPAPTAENHTLHSLAALSPLSSLTSVASPTPPPGNLYTPKPHVTRSSRKVSTGEAIYGASSLSRLTSHKEATAKERTESKKRKAQDPLFDVLLNQREEARKRARAEGYDVPDSDSEVHESIEGDGQKSLADHSQDCDVSIGSVSDYSEDADELVGHGSSTSYDFCMNMSSQNGDDDQGFPEHSVRRHDPSFVNHMNGLIDQFAFEKPTAGKAHQKASFRLPNERMIDKPGKAVNPTSTHSEDHDGDDEEESSRAHSRKSAGLVNKIKSMAHKLATDQDVVGLQQALTMIECIRNRRGPPKTSALGLHFNVPNSNVIQMDGCAEQLKQLRVSIDDPTA